MSENEKLVEDMTRRARTVAESIRRPGGKDSKAGKMLCEMATALTLAQARIRELEKRADHYGVALMMIRAGCSDPARFAGNILDGKRPIDIDIEDELP